MSRRSTFIALACIALALAVPFLRALGDRGIPAEWSSADRRPSIRPDYCGTVIPPNIAPLNFVIEEPGTAYRVQVHGEVGDPIVLSCPGAAVSIPPSAWRKLLEANRGGRIGVDVYAKHPADGWVRFDTIENSVAEEEIDSHLVYRLLGPAYYHFGRLGIYQRNLENFDESPLLRNSLLGGGCVNCHAFQDHRPERFSLHVRPPAHGGSFAPGMIGVDDHGPFTMSVPSPAMPDLPSYTSWHPTEPLAVFSLNHMGQFMHGVGIEAREVYDQKSSLAAIHAETKTVVPVGGPDPEAVRSFPAWSGDGKELYFCSAPALWGDSPTPPYRDYARAKYDLMRIRYDPKGKTWGNPEPVLTAETTGLSISEPRPSPDGRFLVCCMSAHGAFPVLQASSDLYLLDLPAGNPPRYRPLANANSPECESWHSWSSNSRWLVFSSKRGTGLFARPWICYIDREGKDRKPFLLPQQDPRFYDTFLKTYNVPELVRGPVRVSERELADAARALAGSSDAADSRQDH